MGAQGQQPAWNCNVVELPNIPLHWRGVSRPYASGSICLNDSQDYLLVLNKPEGLWGFHNLAYTWLPFLQ